MVLKNLQCIVTACRIRRPNFPARNLAWKLQELAANNREAATTFGQDFFDLVRDSSQSDACNVFCDEWLKVKNNESCIWIILAAQQVGDKAFADFIIKEIEKAKESLPEPEKNEVESLLQTFDQQIRRTGAASVGEIFDHNVPRFRAAYHKRGVDTEILQGIINTCKSYDDGTISKFLAVTGDAGVGKSTTVAELLSNGAIQSQLYQEANITRIMWLNCIEWRDVGNNFDHTAKDRFNERFAKTAMEIGLDGSASFLTVRSVISYFRTQAKRVLFVLDDVYKASLLAYVAQNIRSLNWGACCVITREFEQLKMNETGVISDVNSIKIPPVEKDDLCEMLSVTFRLKKIFSSGDYISNLAKRCCGLPLIASLISANFNVNGSLDSNLEVYKQLLSNELGLSAVAEGDRSAGHNVYTLMQLSLDQLWVEDRRCYYAFLFFNPAEIVSIKEVALLWGYHGEDFRKASEEEIEKATRKTEESCEMLERRCLLRGVIVPGNDDQDAFLVHQMLHEAAFVHARRLVFTTISSLQELRFHIVVGDTCKEENRSFVSSGRPVAVLCEAIKQKQRSLLEKLIEKLASSQLNLLCTSKTSATDGKSFIHHLYSATWPDDATWDDGKLKKLGVNNTYRLLTKMCKKLNREKVNVQAMLLQESEAGTCLLLDMAQQLLVDTHHTDRFTLFTAVNGTRFLKELVRRSNTASHTSEIDNGDAEPSQQINRAGFGKLLSEGADDFEMLATALVWASGAGRLGVIRFLLAQFPDCNKMAAKDGRTPLMEASKAGHGEIVAFLYEKCPDAVGLTSNDGKTALMFATFHGHLEIVVFLYDRFPDAVKMPDINGNPPLVAASLIGHPHIVQFLCDMFPEGANMANKNRRTALMEASNAGHLEVVKILCDQFPDAVNAKNKDGNTALTFAAMAGHFEVVQFLCEKNSDAVRITNSDGRTALMLASVSGNLETVELLYEKFPDAVKTIGKDGHTALTLACVTGHLEIAQFLYDKFPEAVKITQNNGHTPLMLAAVSGHLDIVQFLYDQFPDAVKITNNNGHTPLMLAIVSGHLQTVQFLYDEFPEAVKKTANDGRTALILASESGHFQVVEFIYKQFPDAIKMRDNDGYTALMRAAVRGHLGIVTFLYGKAPDAVNMMSNDGLTAAMSASAAGHQAILEFLCHKASSSAELNG